MFININFVNLEVIKTAYIDKTILINCDSCSKSVDDVMLGVEDTNLVLLWHLGKGLVGKCHIAS